MKNYIRLNNKPSFIASCQFFLVTSSICFAFSVCTGITTPDSHAESGREMVKVATVDVSRIMNELEDSQKKRSELNALSSKAKQQVANKKAALKKQEEELQKNNINAQSEEAEEFRKSVREFERFVHDTEEDLKRQYLTVNKTLSEKAMSAIENYAKNNKIQLVLDKSSQVRGPVLFGTPEYDITDVVIESMND